MCVFFASGLFRCTAENICLYASEVCDGVVHCQKSHEDEISCKVTCPEFCLCNNTVALCKNIMLLNGIDPDSSILGMKLHCPDSVISPLQFHMFHHLHFLDFSACGFNQYKVQHGSGTKIDVTFFDLSGNSVESIIPFSFQKWSRLSFLFLQDNHVKRLRSFSFVGIKKLWVMNISKNAISTIKKQSFNNITSVQILDLSFNMLNKIVKYSIDEIDTIAVLILTGNSFENIQVVNFIHHIKIDNKGFCCFINTKHCSSDSEMNQPVYKFVGEYNYSFNGSKNNYSFNTRRNFGDGDSHCRYLIKHSTITYLFWGILALCVPVNALLLFVKIVPHNKSELRIFNFNIFLFDFLKCLFLLALLSFDSRYKATFSVSYLQWRKSMLCLFLGNVYFVSKQMILHTILGHVLFAFYVVSSVSILKSGEMSGNVFTFQLFGCILWLSASLAGHILTHPDSDLCLSLTSGLSIDIYVKLFVILTFILNAVMYCVAFFFSIKIFVRVLEVEKQAKKKREKNWILKLYFIILVNFLCGFVTDVLSICMLTNLFVLSYEILLVVALFPAIIHPLLLV